MVASATAAAIPTLVVQYGHRLPLEASVLQTSTALWFGMFLVSASRFAAVFMVVTSTLGLRFKAFPPWLVIFGYVSAALLFLTDSFSGSLAVLFPIWLATAGITMVMSGRGPSRSEGMGVEP